MVIWSILTQQAWEQLQRKGYVRGSRHHAEKDFLPAYLWMAQQMERRLKCLGPSRHALPVWAWYQYDGAKRRKPDLRSGAHLSKGAGGVRIECEVEDGRVLLSDFELWHFVLNYGYLAESEKDDEEFQQKLFDGGLSPQDFKHCSPSPCPAFSRSIEKSWERIFDVTWADRAFYIAGPPEKKSIQATLWEIRLADVTQSKAFTSR